MSTTRTNSGSHANHVENHNKMGFWGALAFVVGNIVGSGLFITPTFILTKANSVGLSLIIWAVSAAISILAAYCYVELGTSIRRSGADFAYLCYVGWFPAAFAFMSTGCLSEFVKTCLPGIYEKGKFSSFLFDLRSPGTAKIKKGGLVRTSLLLTFFSSSVIYPATLAVQAQTFSEYLFQGAGIKLENEKLEYYAKTLSSFALVWLLLFLNFFSVKTFVSRFQIVATASKVISTLTIIVIGFYYLIVKGKTENLTAPFNGSDWNAGHIAVAFFSGLFSYDGWDILNFGAEEIENPKRTMSLAIIIGMLFVAVLYLSTNLSFFVVLSTSQMLSSPAVATTFAQQTMGYFQYLMPFLVSIVLIGSLNSTLFSASRYLYAGAREGQFPAFIAIINREHDSPRCALFYHVVMAMIFSFAGNTDQLISYLGFSQWMQRSFTMCALLYIRITHKPVHPDRIQTPIILPIAFLIICSSLVVLTIVQEIKTAAVGLSFLVAGLCFYLIFLWDKTLLRYDCYRLGARTVNEKLAVYNQIVFNGVVDHENTRDEALEEIQTETRRRSTTLTSTNKVAPEEGRFVIKQRF